jgi:hypothetical protein
MKLFILLLGFVFWGVAYGAADLPDLPQTYIDTTYSAPTGATCTAANSSAFQTCLNNAALNSTIVLQAGTTYTGPFTLPNKTSGSGWIYIVSSNLANLPATGTRVSPSHSSNMPKIVATSAGGNTINTATGAHHYRFVGIEFAPVSGNFLYNNIQIGSGETTRANLPKDIVFDRCYIHGDPSVGGRRGVAMNGTRIAVIDSYVSDFKEVGADTQALWVNNTCGPIKIVNNYLEGSTENVMIGGSVPQLTSESERCIPSDIEIRRNYFFKPLSWMDESWQIKNLLEFKSGQRVLVEGNVFENNWQAAQAGFAVVMTPATEGGQAPWITVYDVTVRYNIFKNIGSGMNLMGQDGWSPRSSRLAYLHNVVHVTGLGGAGGRCIQMVHNTRHVLFDHNTLFCSGTLAFNDNSGGLYHDNFEFKNNIAARGQYGFFASGAGEGTSGLNAKFGSTWIFTTNAIWGNSGVSGSYPANNYFPANAAAVGFVDYAGGNYRLSPSSPYKNAGTDGKDLGADIDALDAATAGVVEGTSDPDTTPPTVTSRVIPSAGTTFVMGFNESVTFAGAVPTLTGCSGGATTLTYASGSGGTSLTFNVSRTVLGAETGCVNSYTQPGNGIEDLAGNDLASFSNQAVTNNSTQVAPDTQNPTTPTNLTATAVSTSQINLSWTASTDNVGIAGYDIRRCSGSGCTPSSIVHNTTGTGTTWNNTGLSASTIYRYDVRARDAVPNYSSYSTIAQATTQTSTPGDMVLSNLLPASGTKLAKTATTTTIGVTTSVAATCRWGNRPNLLWANLVAYTTTGGTSHSSALAVVAGGVYQVCSRCYDAVAELFSSDSCTNFSVTPKPKFRVGR